jgi:hypothetical protein
MDDRFLEKVMAHSPYNKDAKLQNLRAVFAGSPDTLTPDNTYNKDTCFEFHELLLATLMGYSSTLKVFRQGKAGTWTKAAEDAWLFALLLWRIAYSRILSRHLQTLQLNLHLPAYDEQAQREADILYSAAYGEGSTNASAEEKDEGAEDAESSETEADITQDVVINFKRWIRVQVQHIASLKYLTEASTKLPGRMEVSLAAVKPCQSSNVIPWDVTIRHLFPLANPAHGKELRDAEYIIQLLQTKIESVKHRVHDWKCRAVLRGFVGGDYSHFGIHCEAILACLYKYVQSVSFAGCDCEGDSFVSVQDAIKVGDPVYHIGDLPFDLILLRFLEFRSELHRCVETMLPRLLGAPRNPQKHLGRKIQGSRPSLYHVSSGIAALASQ